MSDEVYTEDEADPTRSHSQHREAACVRGEGLICCFLQGFWIEGILRIMKKV
jgi:hypothetical protein